MFGLRMKEHKATLTSPNPLQTIDTTNGTSLSHASMGGHSGTFPLEGDGISFVLNALSAYVVYLDSARQCRYANEAFARWVQGVRAKLKVQVVKRSDTGFKVLPRRWVVERTFAWFMRQRRLVRDYETTETSAEAWMYVAMIRIQLRRLA